MYSFFTFFCSFFLAGKQTARAGLLERNSSRASTSDNNDNNNLEAFTTDAVVSENFAQPSRVAGYASAIYRVGFTETLDHDHGTFRRRYNFSREKLRRCEPEKGTLFGMLFNHYLTQSIGTRR